MRLGKTRAMILLAAAALLPCSYARAEINEQKATAAWRQADLCARDAFKKFPDHTPEGNAQRETVRRECMRNNELPAAAGAPRPGDAPQRGEEQ